MKKQKVFEMTDYLRSMYDEIVALEEVQRWLLKPIGWLFPKRAKLEDVLQITKQLRHARTNFWLAVKQKYPDTDGLHLTATAEKIIVQS